MKGVAYHYVGLFIAIVLVVVVNGRIATAQQSSPDAKGQLVNVHYDERQDITNITLNPFVLVSRKQEELRMGAVTAYKGKTKIYPKETALLFLSLSSADSNKYESARKLTLIIDGQRFPLGETSRTKQTQNGLFIDTMMLKIPTDLFVRLSRAKAASIKLGFTEVPLVAAHFNILRVAASYITE